jgi:hypothetical protein
MKTLAGLIVGCLLGVVLWQGRGEAAARPYTTPTGAPTGNLTLTINASAGQHPISPHIYGINFASEELAADLDLPVNRWGGNATSLYNWELDATNLGSDWYFENYPNQNPNPGNLPFGSDSDEFVQQNLSTGTETLLTIPMTGWAAKSRNVLCAFSIATYGPQQDHDPWYPDCGNGRHPNGTYITGNNPNDASMPVDETFVQGWIGHLVGQFGTAANGGVQFYALDNEPMLWDYTHRDVHPEPTSYDEMRDRTYTYAAAIKEADPTAQTLGPVLYGWTAYFYSALDWAAGGAWWNNPIDRLAHGNVPFTDWYLQQMQAYEQQNGIRILDYLDLHYYPAADGVTLAPAGDANTQALRLRSTRSLWDDTYIDESWIGQSGYPPVELIPRMHDWVDTHYPGTKLAITEYNWGALDHINGALAQADVLGIFGREGLDLATLWAGPEFDDPGAFAFRLYRNYDGQGGKFGDTAVSASSSDQAQLSVYAARRTGDGALTVIVINKSGAEQTAVVNIAGFPHTGVAQVFRYSPANLNQIVSLANQPMSGGSFTATFPTNSMTLFVLPFAFTPTDFVYLPVVVR